MSQKGGSELLERWNTLKSAQADLPEASFKAAAVALYYEVLTLLNTPATHDTAQRVIDQMENDMGQNYFEENDEGDMKDDADEFDADDDEF